MSGKDVLRISEPFIAMGAVWAAQKVMSFTYEKATGEPIPAADDLDVPVVRVMLYASAAAVLGAIVTTSIHRAVAQSTRSEVELP